ncbi:hypothetical protein MUP77_22835 [Candidatus Bathyarchaeota archaeon]|nr:hypothetical protein [Candidatus Bathyarchaeota archaeon]
MADFKFKDLKRLGTQIGTMCMFAEQIKAKVNNDLAQIVKAKTFINGIQETLQDMNSKLQESEKTLANLQQMLE